MKTTKKHVNRNLVLRHCVFEIMNSEPTKRNTDLPSTAWLQTSQQRSFHVRVKAENSISEGVLIITHYIGVLTFLYILCTFLNLVFNQIHD
jgi:hypothetical protein